MTFVGCSNEKGATSPAEEVPMEVQDQGPLTYRSPNELPQFADFKKHQGLSLTSSWHNKSGRHYGLQTIKKDPLWIVLLNEASYKEGDRRPYYTLIEQLEINDLGSNGVLSMASCEKDNRLDERIIAGHKFTGEYHITDIDRAWMVDFDVPTIVPIDVAGITCEDPSYVDG